MHRFIFACTQPNRPSVIMAESGEVISYRDLEAQADRNAQLLRALGLRTGDCVAAMLENGVPIFETAWVADRSPFLPSDPQGKAPCSTN